MRKNEFTFEAIELPSASEAIQHVNADPRVDAAVMVRGKYYAVTKDTAQRISEAGIAFAFIHEREMPTGDFRIVAIPPCRSIS